MTVRIEPGRRFENSAPVLVIGAGACGLIAALAARDAGADVLVLEQDRSPSGSTGLSSGFIPASYTRWQEQAGVIDSPGTMMADLQAKCAGVTERQMVRAVTVESKHALHWLADAHGIPFELVGGFLYPGHSAARMHAVPERTGQGLMTRLISATQAAGVDVLCDARVTALFSDDSRRVLGVELTRPDGSVEEIGCRTLILACSGFGGDRALVREHIPEIAAAEYFGHPGNRGDALRWGLALGADATHLGAYQGHGSVATPHGVLITWALIMQGGIQVNSEGRRFSNEQEGYSEQAVRVLEQPGGFAWDIYDERLHRLGMEFEDYRNAHSAGAVRTAADLPGLSAMTGLDAGALSATLDEISRCAAGERDDEFGRDLRGKPVLGRPLYAIKVTGALFHTQGGLRVDEHARVCDSTGRPLPNMFAGGGAAAGVSGDHVWGYLSGNGLLSAVSLGALAGRAAARTAMETGAC